MSFGEFFKIDPRIKERSQEIQRRSEMLEKLESLSGSKQINYLLQILDSENNFQSELKPDRNMDHATERIIDIIMNIISKEHQNDNNFPKITTAKDVIANIRQIRISLFAIKGKLLQAELIQNEKPEPKIIAEARLQAFITARNDEKQQKETPRGGAGAGDFFMDEFEGILSRLVKNNQITQKEMTDALKNNIRIKLPVEIEQKLENPHDYYASPSPSYAPNRASGEKSMSDRIRNLNEEIERAHRNGDSAALDSAFDSLSSIYRGDGLNRAQLLGVAEHLQQKLNRDSRDTRDKGDFIAHQTDQEHIWGLQEKADGMIPPEE